MNINQLKYVLTVADSSSMREASTKLYVSQPALSASIRELEEELGILIFERTNKGISLTNSGRDFLTYAKKAVGQYEILEDRYLSGDSHRERFSVSTQHYNFAIKAFTEMVRKMDPGKYAFSIHETKTKEVLDDVASLKSEVGIVSFSGSNEAVMRKLFRDYGLKFTHLMRRETYVYVWKDHEFAGRTEISLEELADYPCVSFSGSNEAVMRKLFRDYGLEFTPLMRRETYVYVWKDHEFAGRTEISLEELADYPCVSFDQTSDGNFYLTEEAMADYHFDKIIKSDDRATSMELIAELGGYSIGSGMLSGDDVILQGLTSIKLKEEDPIEIGYITRKGSVLTKYGEAYIEELLQYLLPMDTEEEQ